MGPLVHTIESPCWRIPPRLTERHQEDPPARSGDPLRSVALFPAFRWRRLSGGFLEMLRSDASRFVRSLRSSLSSVQKARVPVSSPRLEGGSGPDWQNALVREQSKLAGGQSPASRGVSSRRSPTPSGLPQIMETLSPLMQPVVGSRQPQLGGAVEIPKGCNRPQRLARSRRDWCRANSTPQSRPVRRQPPAGPPLPWPLRGPAARTSPCGRRWIWPRRWDGRPPGG